MTKLLRLRRPAHAPRGAFALAAGLFLAAPFVAGCGRHEAAPTALIGAGAGTAPDAGRVAVSGLAAAPSGDAARGLFLDLAVGNHAVSERVFRYRITPTGAPEPGPWMTIHATIDRRIDGLDSRNGVTYLLQNELLTEDPGGPSSNRDLLRQDRSGLYSWQEDLGRTAGKGAASAAIRGAIAARGFDARTAAAFTAALSRLEAKWAAVGRPLTGGELEAARAGSRGGGVGAHEITLLQYPLHPGASWDGRVGFNVWTVEARERVVVPAGAFGAVRLRIDLPVFGPADRYLTWWSGPGEIANQGHFETIATDETGTGVGTVETEQRQQLTSWSAGAGI